MEHFLLINKPKDWTSFDVVGFLRKKIINETGDRKVKVGHAGTLDPFATGLLIVGVGRTATRRLDDYKKLPKTYLAVIKLGESSDTYDKTGVITRDIRQISQGIPTSDEVKKAVNSFLGKQLQVPPMFSAKKIAGKRLYELARQGKTVERTPSEIEVYSIKLLDYAWPELKVEISCSTGTYIRTIAHELGERLGTGALCQELVRTQIGEYRLADALDPQEIKTFSQPDQNPA